MAGFFEGLLKDIEMIGAIEASRNSKGKADPYKAAGLYYGLNGDVSLDDAARLGTFLGGDGAFSDDED